MTWLDHKKFIPVRDATRSRLSRGTYRFKRLKHVVFLCGGANSAERDNIAHWFQRHHPDTLVFYADHVWEVLADKAPNNALEMESWLAELADIVPIVVQSPGTFAEIGAFTLDEPLRLKLLPIIDRRYEHDESFLNTGPVKWINETSLFRPSIYADFAVILNSATEITDRLSRIPRTRPQAIPNLADSKKHLTFFLCDLVALFGPCPASHIVSHAEAILGTVDTRVADVLVSLLPALGLVRVFEHPTLGPLLYRRLDEAGKLPSFHRGRFFNVGRERVPIVGTMLRIKDASSALDEMRNDAAL